MMGQKIRSAVLLLLLVTFLGSSIRLLYQNLQYGEGEENYAKAEALISLPEVPSIPRETETEAEATEETGAIQPVDFSALQKINSDVFGWIMIPGTGISYPLLQGQNNNYYLYHTWDRTRNNVGAIFLDWKNNRDLQDFNTVIYGHRMNNQSMFGKLKEYGSKEYWNAHPYIYIWDSQGEHIYHIFSACEVSVLGDTYQYQFSDDAEKQRFLDFCCKSSKIRTGVVPGVSDRILTLSTCTGNGHATRWVVQAVLLPETAEEAP